MTFDAAAFAAGWLAAQVTSEPIRDHAVLHRSLSIDLYPGGARFTSIGAAGMTTAWVPAHGGGPEDAPALRATPDLSIVVHDIDRRARHLCLHIAKRCIDYFEDPENYDGVPLATGLTVTLTRERVVRPQRQLAGLEQPLDCVIEFSGEERVVLPVADLEFPPWRDVFPTDRLLAGEAAASLELSPASLSILTQLAWAQKKATAWSGGVRVLVDGVDGPLMFVPAVTPGVLSVAMPGAAGRAVVAAQVVHD